MTIKTSIPSAAATNVENISDRVAAQAETTVDATRQAANKALDAIQSGVDGLREAVPGAFARAAAQVEDLTRRGLERARSASAQVRDRAVSAGDKTVTMIRDEPVKSVLIAAAAGAAVAALVTWLVRSRSDTHL